MSSNGGGSEVFYTFCNVSQLFITDFSPAIKVSGKYSHSYPNKGHHFSTMPGLNDGNVATSIHRKDPASIEPGLILQVVSLSKFRVQI